MKRKYFCHCCKQQFYPSGMLGGIKSCKCETAECSVCKKCIRHCVCPWGQKAHYDKIVEAAEKKKSDVIITPLRERVEDYFKLIGKQLDGQGLTPCEKLLRDALSESATWFTMYQAWVKRAEESESELAQLREKLALSKDALKMALRVIDSLDEQQAMEDNSFLTQREIVAQALAIIDGKDVLKEGEL